MLEQEPAKTRPGSARRRTARTSLIGERKGWPTATAPGSGIETGVRPAAEPSRRSFANTRRTVSGTTSKTDRKERERKTDRQRDRGMFMELADVVERGTRRAASTVRLRAPVPTMPRLPVWAGIVIRCDKVRSVVAEKSTPDPSRGSSDPAEGTEAEGGLQSPLGAERPRLLEVLESAAKLQRAVPDAVLVG